jgi:hypothetical protein
MEGQFGSGSMGPGGDDAAKAMLASINSHFDADDDAELSRLHQSDIDDDDEVVYRYSVNTLLYSTNYDEKLKRGVN